MLITTEEKPRCKPGTLSHSLKPSVELVIADLWHRNAKLGMRTED